MRRFALPLLAAVAFLHPCSSAAAATGGAAHTPIHVGDASPIVCGVKWEISGLHGHRPNIYTVRGTYTRPLKPDCNYAGKAFGEAVVAYKYRLGYPTKYLKPIVGSYFLKLLRGPHDKRPLLWIALAQRRAKAIQVGPSDAALKIIAWERKQIGTRETCGGSCNRGNLKGPGGYSVDDFERAAGLLGQPWCGIFQWNGFLRGAGVRYAPPPFNPFYVPSIGQWALDHGYALVMRGGKVVKVGKAYVDAKARVGALVAFLRNAYVLSAEHVGIVSSINRHGYYTIEGNSGDAVREHYYPWGTALRVFVHVPGVS